MILRGKFFITNKWSFFRDKVKPLYGNAFDYMNLMAMKETYRKI